MKGISQGRKDVYMMRPEDLTLVYDKAHPMYDPRVEDAPAESMIANIAMHGVLEPIIVRKNGSAYEVVAGRGRTKATIEANKRLVAEGKPPIHIPCIMRGGSDADLYGVMISENEIRREDGILLKGEKARKLLNMGYTAGQIAVVFGVGRSTVETWLAADELPQVIKDAVESGEISASAATKLASGDASKAELVDRYNALKDAGEKPTVRNLSAAPKMKSRAAVADCLAAFDDEIGEYADGYRAALQWVLGSAQGDAP